MNSFQNLHFPCIIYSENILEDCGKPKGFYTKDILLSKNSLL
jgi:hypothetical protein